MWMSFLHSPKISSNFALLNSPKIKLMLNSHRFSVFGLKRLIGPCIKYPVASSWKMKKSIYSNIKTLSFLGMPLKVGYAARQASRGHGEGVR